MPKPLTSTKIELNGTVTGDYHYSYAQVETSKISPKDSSGSVIRNDQHAPSYEYISMASAEPASPEKLEEAPTVTLNVSTEVPNENSKVTFKRSIYDDDFYYEVIDTTSQQSQLDPKMQPSPAPQLKSLSLQQSNHYDVPCSSKLSMNPVDVSPTYDNVSSPPPYSKLNSGMCRTQPTSSVHEARK